MNAVSGRLFDALRVSVALARELFELETEIARRRLRR